MSTGRLRGPAIGDMDRLVTIRAWTDTPTTFALEQQFDAGQPTWASLTPVGTAIFYGTQQVGEDVTHRLACWRTDTLNARTVTARHVVECYGLRYRVKRATDMNGERAFLMLDLKELGAIT